MLAVAEHLGFHNIHPVVLGNAGNLVIYLAPYQIVARVAILFPDDDSLLWKDVWVREIKVAKHLIAHGIPVVPYAREVSPGPYLVSDTWMTLWEYAEPAPISGLTTQQAMKMVHDLDTALAKYKDPLPLLGAWRNVAQAADDLSTVHDDSRVVTLLMRYNNVNERIHHEVLYPAHGDAHPGNLLATKMGWQWIDFEDVSLMPKFWDLASFIGNTALFQGLKHPLVQSVAALPEVLEDRVMFQYVLQARVIMSTIINLALSLRGYVNLDFAQTQLARIDDFLCCVDQGTMWR
ncbi:phosphotransferase [Sulfobacillus thermosulfidooxidans]|uniref:phosphotransferase n=1 Tax=Sulfobacillus thermosulfidooxidans TaxID=28034 RepID=UPI0006B456D6|nr:phosphotransferase [Sulfobacillus thermosulfidooxidans]